MHFKLIEKAFFSIICKLQKILKRCFVKVVMQKSNSTHTCPKDNVLWEGTKENLKKNITT